MGEAGIAEPYGGLPALETSLEASPDGVETAEGAPRNPADLIFDLDGAQSVDLDALLTAAGIADKLEAVDWVYPMRSASELLMVQETEGVCRISAVQPFETARLIVGANGEHWIVELHNGIPASGAHEETEDINEVYIDSYDTPMSSSDDDKGPAQPGEGTPPEPDGEDETPEAEPEGPDMGAEEIVVDEDDDDGSAPEEDEVSLEDADISLEDAVSEEMVDVDLSYVSSDDEDGAPAQGGDTESPAPEGAEGADAIAATDDVPVDDGDSGVVPEAGQEDPSGEAPEALNGDEDAEPAQTEGEEGAPAGEAPEGEGPSGESGPPTDDGQGRTEEGTPEGTDTPEDGETPEGTDNPDDEEVPEGEGASEGSEPGEGSDTPEGSEPSEGGQTPEGGESDGNGEGSGEDGETGDGEGSGEGGETGDGEGSGEGGETGDGEASGEGGETGDGEGTGEGGETGDGEGTGEGGETGDGEPAGAGDESGTGTAQSEPRAVHAAQIALEEVPLSLTAMMRLAEANDPDGKIEDLDEAAPEAAAPAGSDAEGAPDDEAAGEAPEGGDPAAPADGPEGDAPAATGEAPAVAIEDWQLEYDDALLAVEFTGEDYSVMPIASFDEAVITVQAGDTYVLTLGPWEVPEAAERFPEASFEGQTRYVRVSVTAPEGAFPEGTTMRLRHVYDEDTLETITESVEGGKVAVKSVYAVDITFYNARGEEIEPMAPISVVMSLRKAEETDGVLVVHVDEEGNTARMSESDETSSDDTAVGFESDSFSVYAFVLTERLENTIITGRGETYRITLTCGDDAGIPEGARLEVREILEGEQGYAEYAEQAAEAVQDDLEHLRLFDITILYEDRPIEPAAPVNVRIEYVEPVADSGDLSFDVVHFAEENPEVITPEVSGTVDDVDTIDFTTGSFSVYGVVGTLMKHVLASDGHNYRITVTYRADAGVPEGADLEVREILEGSGTDEMSYGEYVESIEEALGFEAAAAAYMRLFDIKIVKDGKKVDIKAPVDVRIELADKDAGELAGQNTFVVHIADGTEEADVIDALDVNGDTVRFEANGFSAYAIVEGPAAIPVGWHKISSVEELTNRDGSGVYIGHVGGYYFTDGITNINSSRTGITKTKPVENIPGSRAAMYHFQPVEGAEGRFRVYCEVGDVRQYVLQKGNSLSFTDADHATVFAVEALSNAADTFRVKGEGGYYWNMQGGANGASFAAYNSASDNNNNMVFWYYARVDTEPYQLDGKAYGLLSWNGGAAGKAMMSDATLENALDARPLTVMTKSGDNADKLFVPKDSTITMWTFSWIGGDEYRLGAVSKGSRKYLKIDAKGLSLVGDPDSASRIRVIPGAGIHAGQVCLQAGGNTLTYSGKVESGFSVNGSAGDEWLFLADLSELTSKYFMTYSSSKVSVSDEKVSNGSRIIVYTRAWNDARKRYEFFAIGADGTLVPCYESGDSIEWVGGQLNSLLWNFVEYCYEGTNTPNYYYDLYNQYSESFLAPQVDGGQILSPNPIGINLNGRRNNRYYSSILAWDDYHYVYRGLKVEDGRIVSCPQPEAMDFYFAIMDDIPVDDRLTTVDTVDNAQYGITMKLVDFSTRKQLSDYLGNDAGGAVTYTQPGLLSTQLGADGYPKAASGSLGVLFDGAREVNHLFIDSIFRASGYYEFDSTQNFASLKGRSSGDFTVYKELGTYDSGGNRPTLKHGQFFPFNDLAPGLFASANGRNLYSATANALSEGDPRKYEQLHLIQNANCYFGLELEASFTQTPNGLDDWGHDIIFEFTGDDDFWLYVDGELVIDLGGIHSALPGTVNFCTGEVNVNGTKTTLRALFEENYRLRNKYATAHEVEEYLDRYFKDDGTIFRDYTSHTMKIFYMERGAGASNLHMRFNLASIKARTVELGKILSGVDAAESVLAEFPYQILYMDGSGAERRLIQGDALNRTVLYRDSDDPVKYVDRFSVDGRIYEDVFLLKPGEIAEISFPDDATAYRVVECGVNTAVYSGVKVNGKAVGGSAVEGLADRADFPIPYASMEERPRVIYDNAVNPEALRTLTIRKKLFEENGTTEIPEDAATFNFRLCLATEFENDLDGAVAGMHTYYVKDPDGNYCRWDAGRQRFVTVGTADYGRLTEAEKALVRFTTSPNGAISKIPANYTVEVRELLAGTQFKVVERPSEIPDGYSFQKYVYGGDSFTDAADGVSDTVVARQDPHVDICNLKGWGLRVNKVWLDADYMAARDDVFFAVYTGATEDGLQLVPGTVRRMAYGEDSLYWYFLPLPVDVPFEQYEIREVRVENPTVDAAGRVTAWDALDILPEGATLRLKGRQKGESEDGTFVYTVNYRKGQVAEGSNVRVDTVQNDRPGITLMKRDMLGAPLAGATFALADNSGNQIGTFTSDADGHITVAFLSEDREYTLSETKAPQGYRGLEAPMTLRLKDGAVTVGNADAALFQVDGLAVTVRNRPFTLQAAKLDADTGAPLGGAKFALHKQYTVDGVTAVESTPLAGFEELLTGEDGVVPMLDEALPAGTYELRELEPPKGYRPLPAYIRFTIAPNGVLSLGEAPEAVSLEERDAEDGSRAVILRIPNSCRKKVSFKKVDGDAPETTALEGATFDLYAVAAANGQEARQERPLYPGLVSGADGMLADAAGNAVFDLPAGIYHLVETQAPKGYELRTEAIRIEVSKVDVKYGEGAGDPVVARALEGQDDVCILTISNTKGYRMPSTGGPGTGLHALAGLALIAFAAACLLRKRLEARKG